MSETFNSVIVGPRKKPIVTMMEEIRVYLMERWAKNRQKIESYNGSVLPKIKKRLEKEQEFSRLWLVRWAREQIYEVRRINLLGDKYKVNLMQRECLCRRWQLTGIPCSHAASCMNFMNQDPLESIPTYYRKKAYEACYEPIIYPTNGQNMWRRTETNDVLPPPLRRPPGRPKRSRNKEEGEKRKSETKLTKKGLTFKCSKCRQSGHNKASCKGPPTATQG